MQNDNNNDATIINSINNIANNSNNDIASIPLEDKFISLKIKSTYSLMNIKKYYRIQYKKSRQKILNYILF